MRSRHLLQVVLILLMALFVVDTVYAAEPSDNVLKDVQFSTLPNDRVRVRLSFEKALSEDPKHFFTKAPAQLIVDFPNTHNGMQAKQIQQVVNKGVLNQFLAAQVGDRLRLVLKLDKVIGFTQSRKGNEYTIDLAGRVQPMKQTLKTVKPVLDQANLKHFGIQDIIFRGGKRNLGRLTVKVADAGMKVDVEKRGKFLDLKFIHTKAPKRLLRRFDVKDFSSPTQAVDLYDRDDSVLVRLTQKGFYKYFAYQIDKEFVVEVEPVEKTNEKLKIKDKVYTGKRISLNFQNIPVRSVLQLLAEFTGTNIVVSDTVTGSITLRLNDVPWDQALDIIMETRALDKRKYGGIMMIGSAAEIAAKERQELTAKMEVSLLSPLISELIQVNYARAADISKLLRSKNTTLLSPRGKVSVDNRTNTLWIQDVASQLLEIKSLIAKLDVPVRQVLIEARVVTIDRDFEKNLGIRFGLNRPKANAVPGTTGDPTDPVGYNVPTRGLQGKLWVTPSDRFNVDLPASSTVASVGTFGVALAKLGRGFLLDLELSALETEGKGQVIASPRLITANQQPAYIESGEEIPYLATTSSGAAVVEFKQAVLKLEVVPQITPDKKLILDLFIKQDRASSQLFNGVPSILTKRIRTRTLIDNGETIVLGGIYEKTHTEDLRRIPFFGKLPLIGPLFRNKSGTDDVEELIIFVTPKIIQQSSITG